MVEVGIKNESFPHGRKFIFNANIQLDEFHNRHALFEQRNSHERADFKHSLMHWIVFGLKESEPSFFSFRLYLTKEIQALA